MTLITKAVANRIAVTLEKGEDAVNTRLDKIRTTRDGLRSDLFAEMARLQNSIAKLDAEEGVLIAALINMEGDEPAKAEAAKPKRGRKPKAEVEEIELSTTDMRAIKRGLKTGEAFTIEPEKKDALVLAVEEIDGEAEVKFRKDKNHKDMLTVKIIASEE